MCAVTSTRRHSSSVARQAARPIVSELCVWESRKTRAPVVPDPAELHEVPPAREQGEGVAVGDGLAEAGQIGIDSVEVVRAAEVEADPADHLVEDQDRALPRRQRAQPLEEVRRAARRS